MNDAVGHISKLFDQYGPEAIPVFCGWSLKAIKDCWGDLFGNGEWKQVTALPNELALAVATCQYKDEMPPVIRVFRKTPEAVYTIKRRIV